MAAGPPRAWKLRRFNLISSRLTLGLRAAGCPLCAGWQGTVKPDQLIYAIWKGSLGAPSRLRQQPFALIPSPWEQGPSLVPAYQPKHEELACPTDTLDTRPCPASLWGLRGIVWLSLCIWKGPC